MSDTALDHRLVRSYLRELDAAMRGLPSAVAHELREQITAHLQDALWPESGDDEVADILRRLGSPAVLAAEAGAAAGSPGSRSAPGSRRLRRRLALLIAVPAVIATVLCTQQISRAAGSEVTSGRDQRLAQLSVAVVQLARNLEDERDLSAAYAARRPAGPVPPILAAARTATDAAARTVRADARGIGAAYEPGTVRELGGLLASLADLGTIRSAVSNPTFPALQVIRVYTGNLIDLADGFIAAAAAGNTPLQGTITTLADLLRVENDQSVQRAILYAALSAQPVTLTPAELAAMQRADGQQSADLAVFTASADMAEQQLFANTVSGTMVTQASEQQIAAFGPVPLTGIRGLDAATWYRDMGAVIGDTRKVTGQLEGQITVRANTLKSNATRNLLLTCTGTLAVLLVLLTSAVLIRPGRLPGE